MAYTKFKTSFGVKLRKIMEEKNITQNKLSDMTGIEQPTISHYVNGNMNPSFYIADKIATALGCSLDEFRDN